MVSIKGTRTGAKYDAAIKSRNTREAKDVADKIRKIVANTIIGSRETLQEDIQIMMANNVIC
jgi:hypothetical protein